MKALAKQWCKARGLRGCQELQRDSDEVSRHGFKLAENVVEKALVNE